MFQNIRLVALTSLFILLWVGLAALLEPAEIEQLQQMLETADLEASSLCFEKDWDLSCKYKLDWQLRQLQNPWQAFEDLRELGDACQLEEPESVPELLCKLGGIAFNLDGEMFRQIYPTAKSMYLEQLRLQVRKPADIFGWLELYLDPLVEEVQSAFAEFSPQEKKELLSFWIWHFIESEDADFYENYCQQQGLPQYEELDPPTVRELPEKLDRRKLLRAGVRGLALSDAVVEHASSLEFKHKKPLVRKSRHGLMVIGTTGRDFYPLKGHENEPICFLLDPAGNDTYEDGLVFSQDFSLLIDMAGNDLYEFTQPASAFHSSFGIGFSYDLDGDDLYRTGDFSFSAFMGINLHQDKRGDDIYQSGLFSQGAAMFGISALIDHSGNDNYQASVSAQGLGSTLGAGVLIDLEGADNYSLGGKYYHEPLMPLDFITLGQGMGMGLRPHLAGGLGLLYDGAGNDHYLGGVYAQGSGYWYATGALIDRSGNDVYNAIYYPQGSGIHLACGFLVDHEGDDAYYSRHGPGQGAGHDWGLGILFDGGGNDAYSIEGGNGLGLTNSVGIFVDRSGNDRYERQNPQSYGSANFVRSAGGIGLFLDAGGEDSYPDSLKANNKTWQQGTYGIGRDIDLNPVEKTAIEELAEAEPLPDENDSIEEIFAAAAEWEVGSAVQRVRKAREILIAREDEAIVYILENKLNTSSALQFRALEALTKSSQAFRAELYKAIDLPDSLAAKNALSLIAGVGDSLLVEPVQRLLAQKKYETTCISVLAGVDSARSVELLSAYIFHPSERFRYLAARSLKQITHPSARETLEKMRKDRSFLVQSLLRHLPLENSE
ncbi:MAG: HEAT repeat domain-containing protein [Candidatus Cloacimonadaceae bacterium]|nr:HEAT repeat domain-containing protein [Candidatus Cloacimonadota bacterium]MDX9949527.1 HEAT repeat domain-containing protein [Candidatus Syntrophosphaera sp.]